MTAEIIQDDVLHALQDFERRGEKFDCVVMDPPYCSGGLLPAQVAKSGIAKYSEMTTLGDFEDGMGALTFFKFLVEVFRGSKRVLRQPGYLFSFIDWRMYPIVFESMERGGLRLTGSITWNKLNSRPNPGQFMQDSEFVIYSTNGAKKNGKFGGHSVVTCPAPITCSRIHPTQKPEKVYAHLYNILEDGARILELFSGSASGGVAAIHNGFDYVGVESSPFYVASSRKRLRDELARKDFLEPKQNKEESKEETPLFPSLNNDDETL